MVATTFGTRSVVSVIRAAGCESPKRIGRPAQNPVPLHSRDRHYRSERDGDLTKRCSIVPHGRQPWRALFTSAPNSRALPIVARILPRFRRRPPRLGRSPHRTRPAKAVVDLVCEGDRARLLFELGSLCTPTPYSPAHTECRCPERLDHASRCGFSGRGMSSLTPDRFRCGPRVSVKAALPLVADL